MKHTTKKTITTGLATLTLLGTVARPAKATDPTPPTTTIETHYNTTPNGVAKDMALAEDFSTIITHKEGDLTFKLYQQSNWTGNFAGNKDYTELDTYIPDKKWTFIPGIKIINDNNRANSSAIENISLIATRPLTTGKLMLAAAATNDDEKLQAFWLGTTVDLAVSGFHTHKGVNTDAYAFGVHNPTIGIWAGRNATHDNSATITLDTTIGMYAFGKIHPNGTGWGIAQLAFGNNPGQNNSFNTTCGTTTSWVLSDQLPRPKFRDLNTYLANQGSILAQIAYNKGTNDQYLEAQAGGTIHQFSDGATLALGAGTRYYQSATIGNKVLGAAETLFHIPTGNLNLNLTGRVEQKPAGGIDKTISIGATYKF